MKAQAPKLDVYTRVTDKIVSTLETGVRPWLKPWEAAEKGVLPTLPLRANGIPYRGVNTLLLWAEAAERGYTRNTWMTYKQAEEKGGHVRKGAKGSMVVYFDRTNVTETDDNGAETERALAWVKTYHVFNVQDIDGLPEALAPEPVAETAREKFELIAEAEQFFKQTGAYFRHGGDRAFYAPTPDFIQLPMPHTFRDAESYAAIKAHELVHWTGHSDRLGRAYGKRFGDNTYAFEELVAELGAAFICAQLGVTLEPREDHAAYLASWLNVLKGDKRAIFTAASLAQQATDYLYSLQPDEETEEARERSAA